MCLSLPILFCLLTVWFCRCSCLCCCLKGEAPHTRPSRCPAHCCLLTLLPNEQQHKKRNRLDGFTHTLYVCVTDLTVLPVWSFPRTKRRSLIVIFIQTHCVLTLYTTQVIWGFKLATFRPQPHTKDINRRMYLLMFHLSRTYNLGYMKHNIVWCVTLGMLVHWAWRGSHPTVPSWSHAHALHLAIAGVIGHSLLMHGFHGLIKGQR